MICCQWTPETTGLFNKERFAAMKPGSVLVNVARGEIVDEDALYDALQQGHLRGVALDVYVGEFERPPAARLWQDPRVLITPHVSGGSDESRHGGIDIFCDNLRAYLDGDRCATSSIGNGDIDARHAAPGLVAFIRLIRLTKMVPRGGVEPPTHGFSVRCSTS